MMRYEIVALSEWTPGEVRRVILHHAKTLNNAKRVADREARVLGGTIAVLDVGNNFAEAYRVTTSVKRTDIACHSPSHKGTH